MKELSEMKKLKAQIKVSSQNVDFAIGRTTVRAGRNFDCTIGRMKDDELGDECLSIYSSTTSLAKGFEDKSEGRYSGLHGH